MKQMKKSEILAVGLMMFSIFFGAGNLIFPPALGQAAGEQAVPAMLGFLLTGVGLPLLGIVAIAYQGGRYKEFIAEKVHPYFAVGLLGILYLTIGPLFAVPRTGAVSFEIGIRPFLGEGQAELGQGIYTALFFFATYYLSLNPSKLMDRIGKMLTPILLLFLAALFARSFLHPLGGVMAATGNYAVAPFAQGFQDGYLTMDLLASIAVGSLVVNTVRMRGVEDARAIGRVCVLGGIIAVLCMSAVYVSLCYLGVTSAEVLGHSANGGQLLANAAGLLFGAKGMLLLAVIIGFACLTTSCGMVSASAWFFNKTLKNRIAYQRLVLLFSLFGFVAANVGLTALIKFSVPFLVAIYPLVIVLVVLSLFARRIGWRSDVYRRAIDVTLVFSVIDGLNAAGIRIPVLNGILADYVPFYSIMLGWLLPALIGAAIGFASASLKRRAARCAEAGKESC